jgi:copper chaperone CopZ
MTTQTYAVTGMTCEHCVKAVGEEISAIDGVTAVDIDLVVDGSSQVRVTSAETLDIEQVRAAVDEAGYELAGTS